MVRGVVAAAIALIAACRFDADGVVQRDAGTDTCASDPCDPAATCTDGPDGFACACPDELTGDGLTCHHRWTALAAGQFFTCGIADDGSLRCWGDDVLYQLGDSASVHRDLPGPVDFEEPGPWSALAVGYLHGCGLFDGALYCWGWGGYGQLGTGNNASSVKPVRIGDLDDWIAVAAGGFQTCGLREGGALFCWGYNGYGQLGLGNTANQPAPVQVAGTWTSVSMALYHTCALHDDGAACWGYNSSGEVGTPTAGVYASPVELQPTTGWREISAGYLHSCGLRTDGACCWGNNAVGQLGVAGGNTSTPTRFSTESWRTLAAGYLHTCGVVIDGSARCWGDARGGQLGDGGRETRPEPMDVAGDGAWSMVFPGWMHTVALDDDGGAWSWGRNLSGELGHASSTVTSPRRLGEAWAQLRAGGDLTCGRDRDRQLACLGWNDSGQLGDATQWPRETAAPLSIGGEWLDVAPADHHACGIRSDQALYCWGGDGSGEIGDGPGTGGSTPAQVGAAVEAWTMVETGANHSCAITGLGILYCWGYNASGQLGNGTTAPANIPTPISGGMAQVDLGDQHTCAIDTAARLLCWGGNVSGEVGDGTAGIRQIPTLVDNGPWAKVTAGGAHTCAIRADGTLWCWGRDQDGELGIAQPSALTPAAVAPGTSWLDVSAGRRHTSAFRDDGTLWCWGDDEWGQIGDGDAVTGDHNLPVQVGTETDWVEVDAGTYHTCARRADDTGWCWGRSGSAQLGVAPWSLSPVRIAD